MHKRSINPPKVKILMFSAGMITGAFYRMQDIIKHIDKNRFRICVAYKPEYAVWGEYEIDLIKNCGATIVHLRGKRLFDPRTFIDIWKILKQEEIDILHSWDVLGVPARIIGKLAGVKIVEEFGNPPPKVPGEISFKHYWINKWTSFLADGFVACSSEIQKRYYSEKPVYFKSKIFAAINNCIEVPAVSLTDDYKSSLRKRYDIKGNEIILTNIGYFNEQKAQKDLLQAFKTVTEKRKGLKLLLVGWGKLEHELKKAIKELDLDRFVTFTGRLERAEVFHVLSITDLFVLSSHWEGFGIVMIEAMALGKPVISTDTDGGREVVKDGETGILVPIKRPDLMAQAILELLENPELMVQMGRRGLDRAEKYFNCKRFINDYEQFYLDVFQGNRNQ
jgi:glycosyltransferase involved in cell wall biosynthesis